MTLPFSYEAVDTSGFGGIPPASVSFERAQAVLLPVPFERTTSYGAGTRHGPRDILDASVHLEFWDEEIGADVHDVGILTLPAMELPFGEMRPVMDEICRIGSEVLSREKFLVALGGEHSITPPLVEAAAAAHSDLSVLQIDAHADLRDSYMGSPHNHACAMRRVLEVAPAVQVGIRSLSAEEVDAVPKLRTRIFYDHEMRRDPGWIASVVDALSSRVYVTIDCDGLDPAIMPAVGTPEPGGLSWYELLALLRAVFERRRVVACDLVELAPVPGLTAPAFLCARLVYKLLIYRFAHA